jgi:hypothetical protein
MIKQRKNTLANSRVQTSETQEKLKTRFYDLLYFDDELSLTDGYMSYIARKLSEDVVRRFRLKRK